MEERKAEGLEEVGHCDCRSRRMDFWGESERTSNMEYLCDKDEEKEEYDTIEYQNTTYTYTKSRPQVDLAFLVATGRRRHTQVNFCGLHGTFEQSLRFRSTRGVWT